MTLVGMAFRPPTQETNALLPSGVPAAPCSENPRRWEIGSVRNGPLSAAAIATAAAAAMACRTCPLLARCTTAANTAPPEHYCVQAGEIWSGGRPMDVQIWLATQKNSNLRRDPITCPRCQARFLPRLPTQRYCRSTCRIADRQAVAS